MDGLECWGLWCIIKLLLMLIMHYALPLHNTQCIFAGQEEAPTLSSLKRHRPFSIYWCGSPEKNATHCSPADPLQEVQALPEMEHLAEHSIPAEVSSASNSRRKASSVPPRDAVPAITPQPHASSFCSHVCCWLAFSRQLTLKHWHPGAVGFEITNAYSQIGKKRGYAS